MIKMNQYDKEQWNEERVDKFPSMDKKVPQLLIKEMRKNLKKEGKKIKKWYYDSNKKLKIEVETI